MEESAFSTSSLDECLKSQGDAPYTLPSNLFCNATWDTVLCWPPTLIGSLTKLPCPDKDGRDSGGFASKECGFDGHWIGVHPGYEDFPKDFAPGWTNYSECVDVIYEIVKNTSEGVLNVSSASVSVGALSIPHNGADIFGAALLVLSLILMVVSLGVTCCNKTIQTTRARFYRNLFAAFIFHDALELAVRLGRVLHSDIIIRDIETCVAFGVLLTLMSMAIFSWFLVIGICYMLTFKGVVVENRMYYVMCLLGWFMPTVATITWLSVTVLGGHLSCWDGELYIAKMASSFWIIQGSIIIFLFFSWLCMLSFLWRFNEHEVHRKYNENKELVMELTNIKQSGFKIAVVLCFLTGAYIIYLSCSQATLTESLSYLLVLVLFSRGIIVSLFMCFLEGHCKCWDGAYAVEGSHTDVESLSSRNSSHPSHYGHQTHLQIAMYN